MKVTCSESEIYATGKWLGSEDSECKYEQS